MTKDELRQDHQERIMRAIRNEPNDRPPLMMSGEVALLHYSDPSRNFEWVLNHPEEMADITINQTLSKLNKIDFFGGTIGVSARIIGAIVFGYIRLPGRELAPDQMWQPFVPNIMEEEDYDYILKHGWKAFQDMCLFERLGYDPAELGQEIMMSKHIKEIYREAGYPFVTTEYKLPSPYDDLVNLRGLVDFFMDIASMPEKVKDVFEVMNSEWEENEMPQMKKEIQEAKARGEESLLVLSPCVNANAKMVGKNMFDEFGWPLIERQTRQALDMGGVIFYHMDTTWTDFLDYWKDVPPGHCIFDTDGGTDLDKLYEMHGKRFAITGTIPPAKMAFGKPDEIYREYREQIEKYGNCYILSPSCSLPANTPKENLDAMYAALEG